MGEGERTCPKCGAATGRSWVCPSCGMTPDRWNAMKKGKPSLTHRLLGKLEKHENAIDAVLGVSAAHGMASANPARRQVAERMMALLTRDQLLREQRRQSAALETMAANEQQRPTLDTEEKVVAFLDTIQRFCHDAPPAWAAPRYTWFARQMNLSGDAGSYGVGAAHTGYAVRRAEESLDPGLPQAASPVKTTLERLTANSPGAEQITVETQCCYAYAVEMEIDGVSHSLSTIPSPIADKRQVACDASLSLLVAPGATFQQRPAGISDDVAARMWRFGYVTRCVEVIA